MTTKLIQIKRWDDQEVIHGGNFNSVKECLEDGVKKGVGFYCANLIGANLIGVDLRGADLRDANLRCANLKCADLSGADLRGVDLGGADLRGVDLSGADLRGADLWNTTGNGKELLTIQTPYYIITIDCINSVMQIGCKNYTIKEWFSFSDDEIIDMDSRALEFWGSYKDLIKNFIKINNVEEGQCLYN